MVTKKTCAFYSTSLKKQQYGVVLIVSLVFLIALTGVVAALMQNTTTDMKMSGASQEKLIASQETLSEIDQIIYNQVRKVDGTNHFTDALPLFPVTPTVNQPSITTGEITVVNPLKLTVQCPRAANGSSNGVFNCNVLNVKVTRKYGRTNNSSVEVNAGIAQQLIAGGG